MVFRALLLSLSLGSIFITARDTAKAKSDEREYIERVESTITVHENGCLQVREVTMVHAAGIQIRHGIVRDFPTKYHDWFGTFYRVPFTVTEVTCDYLPIPHTMQEASNGKRLFIGDAQKRVTPGMHTYTLAYNTNRQLGFFKDHDELHWNVTGTGFKFPVNKVIAHVILPPSIAIEDVEAIGYTGSFDSREQAFTMQKNAHGVTFTTTRPLGIGECFTIAVRWPKGHIIVPTLWQEFCWFMRDNAHLFLFALGVLLLFGLYLAAIIWVRSKRGKHTIIPLFYPPQDLLPGGAQYILMQKYTPVVLAADIINMGVQGWLTIDYVANKTYTLTKKKESDTNSLYSLLFKILFAQQEVVKVGQTYGQQVLHKAAAYINKYYEQRYAGFFEHHEELAAGAIALSAVFTMAVAYFSPIFIVPSLICYGLLIVVGQFFLRGYYTPEGEKVLAQIQGFKLFLETTESERLAVIGTPPTKTPELYETYLPYAVALGVEKEWYAQFTPLFRTLEEQGIAYKPHWYHGSMHSLHHFHRMHYLSHNPTKVDFYNGAISSSPVRPGKTSGFGNGGGAGRGGGGGGVSGW